MPLPNDFRPDATPAQCWQHCKVLTTAFHNANGASVKLLAGRCQRRSECLGQIAVQDFLCLELCRKGRQHRSRHQHESAARYMLLHAFIALCAPALKSFGRLVENNVKSSSAAPATPAGEPLRLRPDVVGEDTWFDMATIACALPERLTSREANPVNLRCKPSLAG